MSTENVQFGDSTSPVDPSVSALFDRYEVVSEEVSIGGRLYKLFHPRCTDDLLDEDDFERDGRIPYWVEIWPSARTLATWLPAPSEGKRRLLELGSGIGLVALAAVETGYQVLATDYYEDALRFCLTNAAHNGVHAPDVRMLDWRSLPDDLERFDVVVASDVLYERLTAALVADVIARTLAHDGKAWLTDPGRPGLDLFLSRCSEVGLTAARRETFEVEEGTKRVHIQLLEITHQRPELQAGQS